MILKIKAFGISKDIVGGNEITLQMQGKTVADLRNELKTQFPSLRNLKSLLIAVNNTYAHDAEPLKEEDEIALIPPVSGG